MADETQIDFAFTNHGTVVMVEVLTDAAKEFAAEHINTADVAYFARDTFPAEPRHAQDLATALYFEHGFMVSIDGQVADLEQVA